MTATSRQGNSTGLGQGIVGQPFNVTIPDAQWWSPDFPNLYDLDVKLLAGANAAGQQVRHHVIGQAGMVADGGWMQVGLPVLVCAAAKLEDSR